MWEKYHWINLICQKYRPVYCYFHSVWSIWRLFLLPFYFAVKMSFTLNYMCIYWFVYWPSPRVGTAIFWPIFKFKCARSRNNWILLENRLASQNNAKISWAPSKYWSITNKFDWKRKCFVICNKYSNGWICKRPLALFINLKRKKLAYVAQQMMNVERSNQRTSKQTKTKSQIPNAKQNNNNHKNCNRKTDKKEDFVLKTLTS